MKKLYLLMCLLWIFPVLADSFSVKNWNPSLLGFSYEGENLDEYLVPMQNHSDCVLHYLSPVALPNDWQMVTQSGKCPLLGYDEVTLIDDLNVGRDTLRGYFLNGFFIGTAPLKVPVTKRTSPRPGQQDLYYFLDEDAQLKVYYFGKMTSILNEQGIYPAFEVCAPFHIILLTENKALFKDERTIQNLFTVVKSYAKTICPTVSHLIFEATDDPTLQEENMFFKEELAIGGDDRWYPHPQNSFNMVKNNNEPSVEETRLFIESLAASDRPAVVFGAAQMDMPIHLIKAAEITNTPVLGHFVVHVNRLIDEKTAWIDYPFVMKATGMKKTGWFLIEADISPLPDFEKKKSGLSLKEPAAILNVLKSYSCLTEKCQEWKKTTYLLEKIEPSAQSEGL